MFIMTEEISGAYKLVIYLSQTSLLFGRLPVVCAAADKDISGGGSRNKCVVNLYIYIMKSQDNDKIPLRFYYILKYTFYTSLELSIWRAVRLHFIFLFLFFLYFFVGFFACGF